ADFIEFASNQPVFFGLLSNPADVKKMLSSNIIDKYLYAEAEQMKMENDEEYLQFKKNYREKVFVEYYKRQHVYPKLSVGTSEIENYYQKHHKNFIGFESALVSIYEFPDMQKAFQGRAKIATPIKLSAQSGDLKKAGAPLVELKMDSQASDPKIVSSALKLNPGD